MKKTVAVTLAACTAGYFYAIAPSSCRHPFTDLLTDTTFAHRGLFDNDAIPENSMPAFQRAVEYGYGIELDVRVTADGQVVVFHDDTLQRMCGVNKKIEKCTYEELSNYYLLNTECTIPLLSDVLRMIRGRVSIIVEIKTSSNIERICFCVYRLLAGYKGVYCVESFNPMILAWFRRYAPDIMRGQLSMNYFKADTKGGPLTKLVLSNMLLNHQSRPHFIAYRYTDKNPGVQLCARMGAMTVGWTFRDQESFDRECREYNGAVFEGFLPRTRILR